MRQGKKYLIFELEILLERIALFPEQSWKSSTQLGVNYFLLGGKQKFGVKVSSRVYRREVGRRNGRVGYINAPATLNIVDL